MKEELIPALCFCRQEGVARKSRNRLGPKSKTVSLASDAAFDVRPGSSPQDVARLDMNTIAKSGRTCLVKLTLVLTKLYAMIYEQLMVIAAPDLTELEGFVKAIGWRKK